MQNEILDEAIEFKINLLKDFRFLRQKDEREPVVRDILSKYKTVTELDNALHKVVRFEETLDEFIARKSSF